jgi:Ca2+-binding EF-hand superfamily protein
MMNEFIGLAIPKKELKRTFDIIDKAKTGRIRMEDIKSISAMLANSDSASDLADNDYENMPPDQLKLRQELDDLYEQLKDKLEKKNITMEAIIYDQLKYLPNQFLNVKGLQQAFERL